MPASVAPYLWYPMIFGAAIAAYAALLASGVAATTAAYLPVVCAGLIVVVLEYFFPERPDWRPRWSDVRADAAFMALIQIVLPQLFTLVTVLAIAAWMHQQVRLAWWPHEWPLAAQIVTMLLVVDFMRYWLHRACHKFDGLWRLHEVHHSPDILYVLNVARFHPIEKALHFALDSIPFLVLGVAPEVIAGYFLLYSVNGFFQHSNVRLRHGWLNHLFATAQIHRWHHARDPRTAYCNFSNTTIIWDVVFGTRYLQGDEPPRDIGIMNRSYPKSFTSQMLTPFARRAP